MDSWHRQRQRRCAAGPAHGHGDQRHSQLTLPWGLILLGVFLVIGVELLGIRSLSFAVGFYLSIATTLAIFCGGVVRWLVERRGQKAGETAEESDVSPGSLYASGLIAAGGIVGLLGIGDQVYWRCQATGIPEEVLSLRQRLHFPGRCTSNVLAVIMFGVLAGSLFYFARKPLEGKK